MYQQYIAISLLFGVQAAELRSKIVAGHYDAGQTISKNTLPLYSAIYEVIGRDFDEKKSLIWNDFEQRMDEYIAAITEDIRKGGVIVDAVGNVKKDLVN